MAQVMKYYNYPETGTGSNTYTPGGWWSDVDYGTLSANFGNTTYNWNEMPYSLRRSCEPLAKFLLHCGIAVNMSYGPDASGSQTEYTANALEQYFRYSNNIEALEKDNYSEIAWNNLLQNELDNNRVIIYSGLSESSGHAWNIDGYQGDNHYHMDWGWGGSFNGYFYLDNLVINIYPESNYPQNCSDNNVITAQFGNIEDGSANLNYQDNQNCTYLFQPNCGSYTSLTFEKFDIHADDYVAIYDGTSTEDELIDIIYGDENPEDISSNGNGLFLNFVTNSSNNASGWAINYDTENCKYTDTLTEASGTISDGSETCDYESSTYCKWVINPEGAQNITIEFNEFNLAPGTDNVKIYKESTSTSNLISKYSSTDLPTSPISVNTGTVIVKFYTGASDNSDGWSLDYSSSTTLDIKSTIKADDIKVYPNPFTDNVYIEYSLEKRSDVKLSITDLIGKQIYSSDFTELKGKHIIDLANKTNFNKGVYFIKVEINGQSFTKKIICINS
jgi:hypothetical protein